MKATKCSFCSRVYTGKVCRFCGFRKSWRSGGAA